MSVGFVVLAVIIVIAAYVYRKREENRRPQPIGTRGRFNSTSENMLLAMEAGNLRMEMEIAHKRKCKSIPPLSV